MAESSLDIKVEEYKRVRLVTITGRVDSGNAYELDSAFEELTNDDQYNIILELSGVDYMSSAGLRSIVAVQREARRNKGEVRIAEPSARVREVFHLAGLEPLFPMFDDTVAAVASY